MQHREDAMRRVTFPRMGFYTEAFALLVDRLGFEPVVPPRTSGETIKRGVRESSDMVCFPFKATLGNLIQGLEMGADTILVSSVNPSRMVNETCRFPFYYHVQEQILRRMGYRFDTVFFCGNGLRLFSTLRAANPDLRLPQAVSALRAAWRMIREIERREYTFEPREVNVGLVGESYTLWEPGINFDIVRKLREMEVGVDLSITLSWYLKRQAHIAAEKSHLFREAHKYFPKRIGGHGLESIINTIDYARRGFDGVIHLLPLSCMPETMVEMVLNLIGEDYHIPIYRFPIDENRFESGFDTRLETFVKLLKRNQRWKRSSVSTAEAYP